MVNDIVFNKTQYDPFVDFLKGICIILVIITHCISSSIENLTLFQLWGRPAVPVFIIIQIFHIYKHGFDFRLPDFNRIWRRVIKPFLFIQLIVAVSLLVLSKTSLSYYLHLMTTLGGFGPGSYYPWIYCQFAIITPMIAPLFRMFKLWQSMLLTILASSLFEIVCCLIHIPDNPFYILCMGRYLFLLFLGALLVKRGFRINSVTICLSIISLKRQAYTCYSNKNLAPFLFSDTYWKYCHWFCYIYIAYLYLFVLRLLYDCIKKVDALNNLIKAIGKCSYEIFLFQMLYFAIAASYIVTLMKGVFNNSLYFVFYIILSVLLSTMIPLIYKGYIFHK